MKMTTGEEEPGCGARRLARWLADGSPIAERNRGGQRGAEGREY